MLRVSFNTQINFTIYILKAQQKSKTRNIKICSVTIDVRQNIKKEE